MYPTTTADSFVRSTGFPAIARRQTRVAFRAPGVSGKHFVIRASSASPAAGRSSARLFRARFGSRRYSGAYSPSILHIGRNSRPTRGHSSANAFISG